MKSLSNSVALALPFVAEDLARSSRYIDKARAGECQIEVRIGCAPAPRTAARVLAYGRAVKAAMDDLRVLVGDQDIRTVLFASSPKSAAFDVSAAATGLTVLAGSLRCSGVEGTIEIDFAARHQEIPSYLEIQMPTGLREWLIGREAGHAGTARNDLSYGLEHAAASMFGDLAERSSPALTVTIGGAAEGRFWAVRMCVREAARKAGMVVAPAVGLILKPLRIPWYQPTAMEPNLEMMNNPRLAVAELALAADPRYGGNFGLKRESVLLSRCMELPGIHDLIRTVKDPASIPTFLINNGIVMGPRMAMEVGR